MGMDQAKDLPQLTAMDKRTRDVLTVTEEMLDKDRSISFKSGASFAERL